MVCGAPLLPAGAVSLGASIRRLHQQLRGVWRGSQRGAQQEVLVLGQVLGWSLLGRPRTVEQLPLQQGKVCLTTEQESVNSQWHRKPNHGDDEAAFNRPTTRDRKSIQELVKKKRKWQKLSLNSFTEISIKE